MYKKLFFQKLDWTILSTTLLRPLFGQYQVAAREYRKKGNLGEKLALQKVSPALNCNVFNLAPQIEYCCAISLSVPDCTVIFSPVYMQPRSSRPEVSATGFGQYFRQSSNSSPTISSTQ